MTKYSTVRIHAFLIGLALSFLLFPFEAVHAKSEAEIDASVNVALERFKKDVKGADDYLKSAKGVLVMPNVTKVGLVIAGQSGEGALMIDGKTVDYYRLDAGSIGIQGGYQEANFVFVFLTQQALDAFRASNGFNVGMEGGITVVEASAGMSADTLKSQASVVAFAFGKTGLMAGWSAKGMKFTKLPRK